MARNEQVTCNVCGRAKGETNHWQLVVARGDAMPITFAPSEAYTVLAALFGEESIEDICGQDCAHKRLSRALDAKATQPETKEVQ